MSQRIINVGIAGQGRSGFGIHLHWLRQAQEQYRVVAVADHKADRRKQARQELGCEAYTDYRDLLKDDSVELIVNALPSDLHPKATIAALKAGKHVVCEKPVAVKLTEFDHMTRAAKDAKRVLAPFQNSRFFAYFQKTQQIIESGAIGDVVYARLSWSGFGRRWDWQTRQELRGGNLNNTGPHPLDQAIMLFGNRTPNVFAKLVSGPGSFGDADDFALVVLHGKHAPTIEIKLDSYDAFPSPYRCEISGTRGGIAASAREVKWKYYDPADAPKQKLWPQWSKDRGYCRETLPWQEEQWAADTEDGLDDFERNSRAFYNSLYETLVNKARLPIRHAEVRRQVGVLEAAHAQNRLPKMRDKMKRD